MKIYERFQRTGTMTEELFAAPGAADSRNGMSDYEDDDDHEEDLRQGYPHPLYKHCQ